MLHVQTLAKVGAKSVLKEACYKKDADSPLLRQGPQSG